LSEHSSEHSSAQGGEPRNPYRPPGTEVEQAADERNRPLAGKGRRLGTLVVDYAGFYLLSACIGIVVALAFGEAGLAVIDRLPNLVVGVVIMSAYYAFFEGLWGRTPGKLLFGTVVVDEAGGRPTLGQIMRRTLSRFIPFEPFSFLGARGWHDSISNTRVVLAKAR